MFRSFMTSSHVTLDAIIHSEISLKDKYWFVCRKVLTKEQNQKLACDVAEIVLPLFEKKYPDDKRPREAIETAILFIAGGCSLDLLIDKRRAYAAAAIKQQLLDYLIKTCSVTPSAVS